MNGATRYFPLLNFFALQVGKHFQIDMRFHSLTHNTRQNIRGKRFALAGFHSFKTPIVGRFWRAGW